MWTIAAVNKKFDGPLGSYNGLTDVHLAHYFSRPSHRSHLKAAKLITEEGFIIPEKNVKGELQVDEKKKRMYDILARSILQNAVHKEGSWNKKLCNYLEDISKMTAVDKARNSLRKKSGKVSSERIFENCLLPNYSSETGGIQFSSKWSKVTKNVQNPYSAPHTCFAFREDGHHKIANLKRCLSAKEHSPYVVPLLLSGFYKDYNNVLAEYDTNPKQRKRKQKKASALSNHIKPFGKFILSSFKNAHHKIVVPQNLKLSQCKITLLYHGHLKLSNFLLALTEDIIIKQQHCGGTPVVIYKGKISVNEMFSFVCLDHEGYFFSIIVFLNGIRELKLSSCCVFRYLPNRRLGGTNGTFSIKKIEGGKPCLKCQYQEIENGNQKSIYQTAENSGQYYSHKEEASISDNYGCRRFENETKNESEVEEICEENINVPCENGNNLPTALDDGIEEIIDDVNNSERKEDSVSEDEDVDESSTSSIEDGIKENDPLDHSASPENISEVSDTYIEPQKYEVSIDSSSSEDEGENQHVIIVSVHGTPEKH